MATPLLHLQLDKHVTQTAGGNITEQGLDTGQGRRLFMAPFWEDKCFQAGWDNAQDAAYILIVLI